MDRNINLADDGRSAVHLRKNRNGERPRSLRGAPQVLPTLASLFCYFPALNRQYDQCRYRYWSDRGRRQLANSDPCARAGSAHRVSDPRAANLGNLQLDREGFQVADADSLCLRSRCLSGQANWSEVLKATFIPTLRFDNQYLMALVAILGTTISPYLFFWQASQEVEEELQMGRATIEEREGASDMELRIAEIDVDVGMFFASLVFYFVILASAATLHATGNTKIETAVQAAQALRPLSSGVATILFALGLIGCGFLAVPVLTSSSAYAVCEAFGWKYGLDEKLRGARRFYVIIAASTLIGMLINFFKIPPVTALFGTAVINGILAPPLLVIIMLVSNNPRVMGQRVNGRLTNFIGWTTTIVMAVAALGILVTWGH